MSVKTVFLRIALALLLLGIALCGTAFALSGFRFDQLSRADEWREQVFTVSPAELTAVSVRLENHSVKAEPSPDGELHIRYYDSDRIRYRVTAQNGSVTVAYEDQRKWYEHIGIWGSDWHTEALTLQLPAEYAGSLSLRTENAGIELRELALPGSLEAVTHNGAITLTGTQLGGPCTLQTQNAAIVLNGLETPGGLDCRTSNGRIELAGVTAGTVRAVTSNGRVVLQSVQADTVDAQTSNGAVSVSKIDVRRSLQLQTSNGKISGDVIGREADFAVTSQTTNSHNNLPNRTTGGEKQLNVQTTNGAIEIAFRED